MKKPAAAEIECPPCIEVEPCLSVRSLQEDVIDGLFSKPRTLPPKYFYDPAGSHLFDQICDTDEYYLTRAESALLRECADEVVARVRPDHIIEFGSGVSRKSCFLLDACERLGLHCTYWPMDICREVVEDAGRRLAGDYPWLRVNGLVGDYTAGLGNIRLSAGRRLGVFMGSTIGNFNPADAVRFLTDVRSLLADGDRLLLGADRVKEASVLNAAYDDAAGLTARFNLNVLKVLNEGLSADFEPGNFEHHAFFNEWRRQVEMHLVSCARQQVYFGDLDRSLELDAGESICTEISRKFTDDCLASLLRESGFASDRHYVSGDGYFSLVLGRAANAS